MQALTHRSFLPTKAPIRVAKIMLDDRLLALGKLRMSHHDRSASENIQYNYVRLFFRILSPLVGAVVGGLITLVVAKETLQDQSAINAYSQFVSEAARIVRLAHEGSQTEYDLARLEGAAGVLMLYGSEEAVCWSFQIMSSVKEPETKVDLRDDFIQMLFSMREEVGADNDGDITARKCPWSLM